MAAADPSVEAPAEASPRRRKVWRRRLLVALAAAPILAAVALWLAVVAVDFPAEWLASHRVESRRVVDRHGILLREALSDAEGRGVWRSLDAVSPWVPAAFVAIEDHRFYAHPGVDLHGIARAVRDNLAAGRVVAGGSTLTQQVVKLIRAVERGGGGRSLGSKLSEAIWALRLERALDKQGILTQYVNRAPFGHGTGGIEAAARLYLDKPASALSLGEAALLCGIPRAPSRNNPWVDPIRAEARRRAVLDRMFETGAITAAQHAAAVAEVIRIAPRRARFEAPHFVDHVLRTLPAGVSGEVRTTLDGPLQREVEALVDEVVRALSAARVGQAAAVVLDNATGEVRAWVGSVDYGDPREGQVDMVLGRRQPGSTLKPFVYGLGLERGFDAADRLPDLPLWFPTGLGDYRPRNYDRRFHGWVSLRSALANSYNVPAVWMAQKVGPPDLLRRLRAVGFQSLDRGADYYGLGLALGNGEVQLIELANAYRTLANEGIWSPVRWRRDMPRGERRVVMPAPVARLLTDILADPIARIPAFGRDNALELPFPAAAKTGTSTDFTDNWTAGYTPAVTVAVWVGNFDGRPMEGVSGITGAGRLWHRVMRAATPPGRAMPFSTEGLTRVRVCADTGELFGEDCVHGVDELFRAERAPRTEPPQRGLRLGFPRMGDVFQLDADTPGRYARLRLRVEGGEGARLAWALDDAAPVLTDEPGLWWAATPGRHRVRVWPDGRPGEAAVAEFTVMD
ncbi:MAG: penicillin-binding protein 1C [Myxococcales bacterium]|nr:penicillin-binding protein 1C [Myxococcales bacterium]